MKLRPILNPDHAPRGDMLQALVWFETRCRMREIAEVTEAEVRDFLSAEEGRPDLAEAFTPRYFLPQPDGAP